MPKVHVNNQILDFIENYNGKNIVKSDDGVVMIHDAKQDTLIIVSMDDSKSCGHRTFDESYNTIEAARQRIDAQNALSITTKV